WPGQVAALIAAYQGDLDGATPAREPDGEPTSGAGHLAALGRLGTPGRLGTAGWALTRPRSEPPAAARTPSRLLWSRETGGPVSSGAAIADGVIYIGG